MKKFASVMKTVFVWIVVVIAVCMMIFTIVSVTTFDRLDRQLFGYRAFIVLSDSMSATDFSAGDLVLIKECDPSTLREGDIISFQSESQDSYGEIITHKIRSMTYDQYGSPAFVTYGTTTGSDDEHIVSYSAVLGKYQFHLPKVGSFFMFMKTTPGYICCIFVPFMLLIIIQAFNVIRLFRQYKKEQMDALKEEQSRLQQERLESQRMMQELMTMKAQLVQPQYPPQYMGYPPQMGEQNASAQWGVMPQQSLYGDPSAMPGFQQPPVQPQMPNPAAAPQSGYGYQQPADNGLGNIPRNISNLTVKEMVDMLAKLENERESGGNSSAR